MPTEATMEDFLSCYELDTPIEFVTFKQKPGGELWAFWHLYDWDNQIVITINRKFSRLTTPAFSFFMNQSFILDNVFFGILEPGDALSSELEITYTPLSNPITGEPRYVKMKDQK